MGKTGKRVLTAAGTLAGIAAIGAGFSAWSRMRFGRSGTATAAEGLIRASGARKPFLGRDLGSASSPWSSRRLATA